MPSILIPGQIRKTNRIGIALSIACAVLIYLLAVAQGHARSIVICNQQGCSDWHQPTSRHRAHHRSRHDLDANGNRAGLITLSVDGHRITVADDSFARRIRGFISDAVARGFRGRIHCYATGGHVRHSLHYSGHACDFAQRGWNRTVRVMYHVADLARKWGLRDGCTFRDCGHIDAGRSSATYSARHYRSAKRKRHLSYIHERDVRGYVFVDPGASRVAMGK